VETPIQLNQGHEAKVVVANLLDLHLRWPWIGIRTSALVIIWSHFHYATTASESITWPSVTRYR